MRSFLGLFFRRKETSGNEAVLREIIRGVYDEAMAINCPYFLQQVQDVERASRGLGLMGLAGSERQAKQWRELSIPLINFSNTQGVVEGMANVLSDDTSVGRLAAEHLIERGYRHFLFVGDTGKQWSVERLRGFVGQVEAHGFPVEVVETDPASRQTEPSPEAYAMALWEEVEPHLRKCPLATGVFVANDWLAWPIWLELEERYPERAFTTALLGVDNLHDRLFDPRRTLGLSSILPGFRRMGAEGLRILVKAVHEGVDPAGLLLRIPPQKIFARASTAGQACEDPVVSQVVRELWAGLRRGKETPIAHLAKQKGMSLRSMEMRFEEHLGQSARDLVAGMRIQLGKELMRQTTWPIARISEHCGYANTTTFSTFFKKKEGCSPREWRGREGKGMRGEG
ncbi:MAG: helix-turn-helix domain-containing protein [Opitutales bacterium]|nr:helix-turn-helix domain-containing protein [Opitutales bacterium]